MKRRAFLSLLGFGAVAPVAAKLASERAAAAAPVAASGPVRGELLYFYAPMPWTGYSATACHTHTLTAAEVPGHSHVLHSHSFTSLDPIGGIEQRIFDGDKWVRFDSAEGHAVWNSLVRGMA